MVRFALENLIRCPAREDRSDNGEDLEDGHAPRCTDDTHSSTLGQEFRSPIEDTHTHNIDEYVGHAERPNPTILEYHMRDKLLVTVLVGSHLIFLGIGIGQLGQTTTTLLD